MKIYISYYYFIMKFSKNNYSHIQGLDQQQNQEQHLNQEYLSLLYERRHIELLNRQFETLNEAYDDSNIIVTSNYYNYIVLLFVVLFLVGLLFRFSLF